MVRQIEALQDFLERVAFQFSSGVSDAQLGGQCALLKVQVLILSLTSLTS